MNTLSRHQASSAVGAVGATLAAARGSSQLCSMPDNNPVGGYSGKETGLSVSATHRQLWEGICSSCQKERHLQKLQRHQSLVRKARLILVGP